MSRKVKVRRKIKKRKYNFPGVELHSTNPRKFKKVVIDYYANPELFENDLKDIIGEVKDYIVWVDVKVSVDDVHKVDVDRIKELLSDAYYYKEIVPVIVKNRRFKKSKINADTSIEDAIDIFIKENNPKGRKVISKLAKELVQEVGLDEN